eukprot:12159491-Alexandrium_andersonii.AAC.1
MTGLDASSPSADGSTNQRAFQLKMPTSSMLRPTGRSAKRREPEAWSASSPRSEMDLEAGRPW